MDMWAPVPEPERFSEWIEPPKPLRVPESIYNPCWYQLSRAHIPVPAAPLPAIDTSESYNPSVEAYSRVLADREKWRKKKENVCCPRLQAINCEHAYEHITQILALEHITDMSASYDDRKTACCLNAFRGSCRAPKSDASCSVRWLATPTC